MVWYSISNDFMLGNKNRARVLMAAAVAAMGLPSLAMAQNGPPERDPGKHPGYRIGAGDVLQVYVWKEEQVSAPTVVVRPDGKISLPLVREVEVVGLTLTELEQLLTKKLAAFIRTPEVSVVVKEIHSEKVFVIGAVEKKGSIPLVSSITVLQALAEAGGLTEYAKRKKIYVLRTAGQKQIRLPFNYDAVIRGEQTEQNILLLPGDTIVVPQ